MYLKILGPVKGQNIQEKASRERRVNDAGGKPRNNLSRDAILTLCATLLSPGCAPK